MQVTDSRSKFKRKKKKNLKTKTLAQITRAGAIIVKDNIQVQQTRFLKKKKTSSTNLDHQREEIEKRLKT